MTIPIKQEPIWLTASVFLIGLACIMWMAMTDHWNLEAGIIVSSLTVAFGVQRVFRYWVMLACIAKGQPIPEELKNGNGKVTTMTQEITTTTPSTVTQTNTNKPNDGIVV